MVILLETEKIIEAVTKMLELLFRTLGVGGTIGIATVFILLSVAWRIYNDKQKEKEINLALAEKDRTISRLAAQERVWRIQFFKETKGWSDEQIDKYLLQNDPPNIPAAREELEQKKLNPPKQNGE